MEFATIIAENVLERLASYASQEISLAWGAQLELTKLNSTLSTIKLVLVDAEKKQVKQPLITHWLAKLKDVCYDVEDVLDELEYRKLRKKVLVNNHGRFKGQVRHYFSRWNPIGTNFRLGHKVRELTERLAEIDRDKSQFSLIEIAQLGAKDHLVHDDRRITSSKVEASSVIGRDADKQQILKHLLSVRSEENVSVVSIVGLGGLGKTTLAKLVYNDSLMEENFETKMWICVSDKFDIQTLVKGITTAAGGPKCEDDDSLDIMETKMQNTLRGRKFLLVLDDVWDLELVGVTRENWVALKSLLEVGANGSKIIITTRNKSVALLVNSNPSYIYSLKGLSHKDCMSLFIQKAFNRGEEDRYPHLIEIGEHIVNKCGGVPLAVATLGSMLYSKAERHQWESVRDDDMWSQESNKILTALKLSYDALPQHLKPCFAFCSLFPKDFLFSSELLVQFWIALGYLNEVKKGEDLLQVGIDYVRQFCSRSLFQVEADLKTQIMFKIHDLVHDLAISVSQVECSSINFRPSSAFEMVRHVSASDTDLLGDDVQVRDYIFKSTKVRTFLRTENSLQMNQRFVDTLVSRFKYMRMLDLGGANLEEIPGSVGSLFHLRYLNLSANPKIKKLPNSICQLLKLDSLNLGGCLELQEIPKDIGNLINLRSFSITTQQTYLPKGIRRLTLLQSLSLYFCVNLQSLGEEMQFFTNLRQLRIRSCENLKSLPPSLKHLTALDTLYVIGCEKLDLRKTREGPLCLKTFGILYSDLKVLPAWLEDSAKALQSIILNECKNLTELSELPKFTSVEELFISDCPNLSALPQELHCLTELKGLTIEDCPELSKNCKRQLQSEDWSKIAREADIQLDTDVDTDDEEDKDLEGAVEDHNAISSDN